MTKINKPALYIRARPLVPHMVNFTNFVFCTCQGGKPLNLISTKKFCEVTDTDVLNQSISPYDFSPHTKV